MVISGKDPELFASVEVAGAFFCGTGDPRALAGVCTEETVDV